MIRSRRSRRSSSIVVSQDRRGRDGGLAALVIVRAPEGSGRDLADVFGRGLFVTGVLGRLVLARRVLVLQRMAGGAARRRGQLRRQKTRRHARNQPRSHDSSQFLQYSADSAPTECAAFALRSPLNVSWG